MQGKGLKIDLKSSMHKQPDGIEAGGAAET